MLSARAATMLSVATWLLSVCWITPALPQPAPSEKDIQAHNAARLENGGRVSLELLSPQGGKDARTMPQDSADGNAHTRCVTWGPPYAFRIELVDKLPVTVINFICSDYEAEQSPKEIEIRLSDSTLIKHTLELVRPKERRDKPRQAVSVGKDIEWLEVKVLSRHPGGAHPRTGEPINWGGIGEIEVITSADLTPYLTVPDYDPAAPVYVEGGSPRSDYSAVKVTMPEPIPPNSHPGIYFSRGEIVEMRERLATNDRAAPMLARLLEGCNEWLDREIVHPDPNLPAQMQDRNDAQARAHSLLSKMAGWLGWAYQLTDDERYAQKAHEILVGYARLYPNDYQEHKGVHASDTSKVMAQRLSEAMWLLPLIQAYDLIYHAPCMTDADRRLIETDLIRHAVSFINRKRSGAEEVAARDQADPDWRTSDPEPGDGAVGNWMNFYNAAYIQAGIVLGDQNWVDIGMANTKSMIVRGIGDDGLWREGTMGYQLFARHALVACLEPLARRGYDLYGYAGCRVKNLWDSPLKFAYPDGTAPGINDSGRAPVAGSWQAMAYDYAYLRYRDPNYGKLVNEAPRQIFQSEGCYFPTAIYERLPERELRALGSVVFDTLGYAILRGVENGKETFLLMDYGPHGGGHGHPDKLNLILFADGDELAGEPEAYRYEDSRHRDWTRPSVAHWTLSVDMHEQAPTTGKLLAFYDAGTVKVMRGVSDGAYAGVGLDRTVVQMPGYIADVYRAWSNADHTYDYPLCFRGTLDAMEGADPAALRPLGPSTTRGYKHIAVRPPSQLATYWTGTWRRDAPTNTVTAILVGAPDTIVYVGQDVDERHRVVARREGREAVFAAVVDPYADSDAVASVERLTIPGGLRAYGLRVKRRDGGTDLIVVRYDQQTDGRPGESSSLDGGSTNALISIVRLDGKGGVAELGMVGGTELSYGGERLTLDQPGIRWSK
ncbi:MAG: heparinase II/III family protein [Armatimonadota bacterium]